MNNRVKVVEVDVSIEDGGQVVFTRDDGEVREYPLTNDDANRLDKTLHHGRNFLLGFDGWEVDRVYTWSDRLSVRYRRVDQ